MGAESSVQRDGKGQEDGSASASAGELSAEVTVLQEGGSALESKVQPSFFDPFLLTLLSAAGTKTNPRERCYFNIYIFIHLVVHLMPPGVYCTPPPLSVLFHSSPATHLHLPLHVQCLTLCASTMCCSTQARRAPAAVFFVFFCC